MKVKCKWCGATNDKADDAYSCVCTECGKTTSYYITKTGGNS